MDDLSPTERIEDPRTDGERELDRANLNMKGMRSSLSMLTAASAQLATALEKRNQEYDALLGRQDEFNRRLASGANRVKPGLSGTLQLQRPGQ